MNGVRTVSERGVQMGDDWLTYEQAAERLNVSPEAVRQKAIRGRWQRTKGNDGKARVRLPDGCTDGVRTASERVSRRAVRTASERVAAERLISALEGHVETLKSELTAERARTKKALADVEVERERAEKAVADYMRLAEEYQRRTDELAAERARPWWKRLAG